MKRRVHYVKDVRRMAAYALGQGGTVCGTGAIRWDISRNCERPLNFTMEGRGALGLSKGFRDDDKPLMYQTGFRPFDEPPCWVDLSVRCRRCTACLKARSTEWSYRARSELQGASRTWFGTMTLRPQEHYMASLRAEEALRLRGTRWSELSSTEQFQERHRQISKDITLWLKRVRKESEARLRYILVAEAHKSGLPHYHILVHERWLGGQTTERTLRRQWTLGHSKFQLVEGSAVAWYVAKYLAKAACARVRASVRYGQNGL